MVNLPGWFQSSSLAFTAQRLIATGHQLLKLACTFLLLFIKIDLTPLLFFFLNSLDSISSLPATTRMANCIVP